MKVYHNSFSSWIDKKDKKTDLAALKSETTPVDLIKLNDVVKMTVHDELVKKVNAIDTSGNVKKDMLIIKVRLKVKYLIKLA